MSCPYSEEECVMHSNSGNIKFTRYRDENGVIEKLFKSLCSRYQENLETSMKGSDSIFGSVQLMFYKCHKKVLYVVVYTLILQTG